MTDEAHIPLSTLPSTKCKSCGKLFRWMGASVPEKCDECRAKIMKLDIGCGKNKREGFVGVDQYAMDGVDFVCDLSKKIWWFSSGLQGTPPVENVIWDGLTKWMLPENSIEEIHCSHFMEHLTAKERMHFMNEAFRVLQPGGKMTVITPHWASNRAYGDMTHQWPPVAEMFYYYLKREWRETQAPHTDSKWNPDGFSCNFDATWGYSFGAELQVKNQEFVQFALQNYKEAAQDMHATLVKPMT